MNDLDTWLSTTTNRFSPMDRKYVITLMLSHILKWYDSIPELEFIHNRDNFSKAFYQFMYKRNTHTTMRDEEMDYFSLRYFSDIVDLFLTCKNIQESCTTSIFTNKDTANDLLLFLSNHIEVVDENDFEDKSNEPLHEDSYY